jgi:hypothetical protein
MGDINFNWGLYEHVEIVKTKAMRVARRKLLTSEENQSYRQQAQDLSHS